MKIIIVSCKKCTERQSMIKLLQTRAGQNTLLFSSHAVQNAVVKEKNFHICQPFGDLRLVLDL